MPVWEHEKMEGVLSELISSDLTEERKMQIASELRDYNTELSKEQEDFTTEIDSMKNKVTDYQKANAELFLRHGQIQQQAQTNEEEQKKSFSETVTLKDLGVE